MKKTVLIATIAALFFCMGLNPRPADAEPFIGEIRIFAGNFAPRNWAFCDGQLLSIAQNSALFSILGTIYGGDGRATFGLPDLRGRVAIHAGTVPGLPGYRLGQRGGSERNTLSVANLPVHNHTASLSNASVNMPAYSSEGDSTSPGGNYPAKSGMGDPDYNSTADVSMESASVSGTVTVGYTGGNQAINNMPPYCTINYIIALQGIYPSRP